MPNLGSGRNLWPIKNKAALKTFPHSEQKALCKGFLYDSTERINTTQN